MFHKAQNVQYIIWIDAYYTDGISKLQVWYGSISDILQDNY